MACAVSGVKLHDAYITVDTMAISRTSNAMHRYYDARTDSVDYKRMGLDLKIEQIIHNEAVKQKEIEDAIQEQSR